MSPKSIQKRSIIDHFSIVPKEKEKKAEVKIHPLFIKKKKVVEEEKKENIAPPPAEPLPTPTPPVKKKEAPLQPKPTTTSQLKRVSTRHDPFESIIKADTQNFFLTQKKLRTANKQQQPNYSTQQALDIQSIEKLMDEYYPQSAWKKDPCCKVLFDTIRSNTINNNKILWCDKYRPNQVNGLLGFLPDYEYLRDWLNNLKIRPASSSTTDDKKKNKKNIMDEENKDLFHLILFVGDHGAGKTAAAYTAAKETGYTVFEINSTCKRTGKDIINQVGEMTASHLVKFDHQQRKRKKKGETIILRDTVKKKPKTVDIAMHFKKMLTVSEEQVSIVEKEEKKDEAMQEDEEEEQKPAPAIHTIESFFKRQSTTTTTNTTTTTTNTTTTTTKTTTTATLETSTVEEVTQKEEEEDEEEDEDIVMEDEPKQSLVLIEEVDILFEEDKGFWPAVIELCQKSKRPIIMTCNDKSQIPFDYLNIQSTIYFDIPEKTSLLPYLQLICFAEKYVVEPYDIEFLCELYNCDTRKIIDTLQLWLSEDNKNNNGYNEYPYLFAHIMGFADLLLQEDGLMLLMDRLKGTSHKTIELCTSYFTSKQEHYHQQEEEMEKEKEEEEVMGIESIYKMMENAAFADAWIGLTDKQRHQIYDIDQYDNVQDMLSTSDILLYKKATDLDHWELGEIIENSISVINLNTTSSKIWRNHLSAWSSHWEYLYNTSKDSLNECSKIVSPLLLSYPTTTNAVMMSEYMPNIRSMCLYDQGVAGKGRTKRSKRKIRYINLDDESRDVINWQQI